MHPVLSPDASPSMSKQDFINNYDARRPAVISRQIVDDLATPIGIYLRLCHKSRHHFLFESVGSDLNQQGRYSITGLDPDIIWELRNGRARITTLDDSASHESVAPLDSLRNLIDSVKHPVPRGLPKQCLGIYGYLGYDAVRLLESSVPDSHPNVLNLPDGFFMRPRTVAVFDRHSALITLAFSLFPQKGLSAHKAWDHLHERCERTLAKLQDGLPDLSDVDQVFKPTPLKSHMTRQEFFDMILKGKTYISSGDVYQIVLSQKFQRDFPLSSLHYYRALRRTNPSPYLFHVSCGDHDLIGSSPEIMVKLADGTITIRPLAGSRPRGQTHKEDERLAKELLNDRKELSEHLMLLDLGRNDAGRHALKDSVRVKKMFDVERYKRIMHIASTVEAKADSTHPLDILLAALPAGTLSGAPKVRAMQLIDALEPARRGFYSGTVGYFDSAGNMDTCIALRSALWHKNVLHFQAGVGVVDGSVPETEYEECHAKLKAMLEAVDEALALSAHFATQQ